jgi:hypothetical protein
MERGLTFPIWDGQYLRHSSEFRPAPTQPSSVARGSLRSISWWLYEAKPKSASTGSWTPTNRISADHSDENARRWMSPDSQPETSTPWHVEYPTAIITTNAKVMMGQLQDRMPAILGLNGRPTWLGEVDGDLTTLLEPSGDDVLRVWPVSKPINTPRNNGAELLEAVG